MNTRQKEKLFHEIYDKYKPAIHRICFGYIYEKEQADDLFQEIMLNIWNSLEKFKGDARVFTWAYKVAVNTALLYNRKTSQYNKLKSSGEEISPLYDSLSADEYEVKEIKLDQLRKSISLLEREDRLIISLILEGLSYDEVAEIVGIKSNYVGVKVSRIKKQLYELLKKYDNE